MAARLDFTRYAIELRTCLSAFCNFELPLILLYPQPALTYIWPGTSPSAMEWISRASS
jgi:hypothetical protein